MTRRERVLLELRALLAQLDAPHPLNRSQIKRTVKAAITHLEPTK